MITCPKCGYVQENTVECMRCGVIFRKLPPEIRYRTQAQRAALGSGKAGDAAGKKTGNRIHPVLALLLLAAMLVLALATKWSDSDSFALGGGTMDGRMYEQARSAARDIPKTNVSRKWYEDAAGYRQALNIQEKTGAPMLVMIWVAWCPSCKKSNMDIIPSFDVNEALTGVLKVRINKEGGDEEERLALKHFKLKSYPAYYLVTRDQKFRSIKTPRGRSGREYAKQLQNDVSKLRRDQFREARLALDRLKYGQAVQAFSELIHIDPRNAENYFNRGEAYEKNQDKLRAMTDYLRATDLKPNWPEAEWALGQLCFETGCHEAAIRHLSRVINANETFRKGEPFLLRARAHQRMGESDQASLDARVACSRGLEKGCELLKTL